MSLAVCTVIKWFVGTPDLLEDDFQESCKISKTTQPYATPPGPLFFRFLRASEQKFKECPQQCLSSDWFGRTELESDGLRYSEFLKQCDVFQELDVERLDLAGHCGRSDVSSLFVLRWVKSPAMGPTCRCFSLHFVPFLLSGADSNPGWGPGQLIGWGTRRFNRSRLWCAM